jgi:hypothetical protein
MPKNPRPKEDKLTREYAAEQQRFAHLERTLARAANAWNSSRQALRRFEKRIDLRAIEAGKARGPIDPAFSDPLPSAAADRETYLAHPLHCACEVCERVPDAMVTMHRNG